MDDRGRTSRVDLTDVEPHLAEWLLERAARGDAIAQHRAVESGWRRRLAGVEPRLAPWALPAGPLLRIDLRPTDPEDTRRMLRLERVLRRARRRTAVTYDELAATTA